MIPNSSQTVDLAVVGAHLRGMPLNRELTERGAVFLRECRTAPCYKLFALPGTVPPKPGLLRVRDGEGSPIVVEVWRLKVSAFGSFVAAIPAPMGIGVARLDDGTEVKGFIAEPLALDGALDITAFGGWRNYVASLAAAQGA
ncbi:amidase [Pelagibacterium halotolerans]|nr:amidase [Pelagibacterium halotolerans]